MDVCAGAWLVLVLVFVLVMVLMLALVLVLGPMLVLVVMVDLSAGARIGMWACCSIHVYSCWHDDA